MEYRIAAIIYLIYLISFLIWSYRSYKNVYTREAAEAPYKPTIVPFCYIIPILNLYGPYQIMRFIWWGNALSVDHLNKGYKAIKLWWFLTLANMVLSRITAGVYKQAVYANEFMTATYFYIALYVLSIHYLLVTLKLVISINKAESTANGNLQSGG